ncbi:MAG: efflux RND transporter periplasmic adaptor subunit [Calditrichaeota bacterium]|nr:MAG: efflux RND transporter periplasmic adaptor subunit [Calditrichota bacterium]
MKRIVIGVLALFLVGMVGYRVITHGEEPAVKDIDAYQAEMGIPVEVERVLPGTLTVSRNFTGTVEGARQADAIANATQKITAIPVEVGDAVEQGQVVAELDVDMASARSLRYRQSRATYEDAKRDYERMKSLFEAGAVSEQALDKAKLAYEIAARNFEAAKKLVKIEAPISGVVTRVYYKVGETAATGRPVVRVADLKEVLIKIDINETQISGIRNGQAVEVSVPAYPGRVFAGKLENLSLSADPRSRTFEGWVRVKNPEGLLRPGMFAKVAVHTAVMENVLTVAKDAIVEKDGKTWVYVIDEEEMARLREVQLGQESDNRVQVVAGLAPKEQVVVLGQNKLQPGRKVNVVAAQS